MSSKSNQLTVSSPLLLDCNLANPALLNVSADVYGKRATDTALALKPNSSDVTTSLAFKANTAHVCTKGATDRIST